MSSTSLSQSSDTTQSSSNQPSTIPQSPEATTRSSQSITPTQFSFGKQIPLKPFDLDPDDSYHFLLAELSPAVLQDIPETDLGDVNHPAAVRCHANDGSFTVSTIKSLNSSIPMGPLYTPDEALSLALQVSSFQTPNWRGAKIPIRSHLNVKALSSLLEKYPDPWVLREATFG